MNTYWLYKFYADMEDGQIINTEPVKHGLSNTVVLATKSESGSDEVIRLLVGRYGSNQTTGLLTGISPINLEINLQNIMHENLWVELKKNPHTEGIPQILEEPETLLLQEFTVVDGMLAIPITNYRAGDAYTIAVTAL